MLMFLSGDWTMYVHLGIYKPTYDRTLNAEFSLLPNGGVTLALQPDGDESVKLGVAVCSLGDVYSRAKGRELSHDRLRSTLRARGFPSYSRHPQLGVRTVDTDELVAHAISSANSRGDLFQFGRLSKVSGVPIVLATRSGGHPLWGWMPDGFKGPATWDLIGGS